MRRIDFFNDSASLIRKYFETYQQDTNNPEHFAICELFHLFDDSMRWFYSEERGECKELDRWREQLELAGVKAHKIYTKLKEKGIDVVYDKNLLKNRQDDCKSGPEKLGFHLHLNAVEDLLNFCIIGTADTKKLSKLKKSIGIKEQNYVNA